MPHIRRRTLLILTLTAVSFSSLPAQDAFPDPVTAEGEVIFIEGRVVDRTGHPLSGAAVEFWQTDARGIYDHPGDSDTARRDPGFQFYGTSPVDRDGTYRFRTVMPGRYEPRPRHIHVKVRQNGRPLLTTQIYFSTDGSSDDLSVAVESRPSTDGGQQDVAVFDIVVDTGTAGDLIPTRSQGEGPYYPRVDVSGFDNDLASVQ